MDSGQTRGPWQVDASDFPVDGSSDEQARFLLQYAVLAPSTHNSQPWQFAVEDGTVRVYADGSRRLDVADPDGRELYVSLGCAVENLVVAATRFGLGADVDLGPAGEGALAARVVLGPADGDPPGGGPADDATAGDAARFDAITDRRTDHGVFEDRNLPKEFLWDLERAVEAAGAELVLPDADARETVAELQVRADEQQFDDRAYRAELGRWIGSGALGANWLTARVGQLAVTHLDLGEREGTKNSKLLRSAPAVALVATAGNDRTSQLRAGRAVERLWLDATTADVAVHPMNQILQVPDLRAELVDHLDAGNRSLQLLLRLGYATTEETTRPRRPVEDVLRE